MQTLFALGTPGPVGMLIILVLAVLLFGNRLPEVARSLGRGLMELRKGLRGLEDEFRSAVDSATSQTPAANPSLTHAPREQTADREEATAPKFEPPPAEPQAKSEPS